jgi:hypothetical protein
VYFLSPKYCSFGMKEKTDFLTGSIRISQKILTEGGKVEIIRS